MSVVLKKIAKDFGIRRVLVEVNLNLQTGESLGLLGRSGSGKTTLLRIVAGLERPDKGQVYLHDTPVEGDELFVRPDKRDVGLVFQDLALWPHLLAAQHLDLVARTLGLSRAERRERVEEWLALCQIENLGAMRPDQLSGGEQQRLALARTLLPLPKVLLLDEPFSGCDRPLVEELKELIGQLREKLGFTAIMVSHDWRDLEGLVAEVAVLQEGRIAAQGTPEKLRDEIAEMK